MGEFLFHILRTTIDAHTLDNPFDLHGVFLSIGLGGFFSLDGEDGCTHGVHSYFFTGFLGEYRPSWSS